MARRAWFFSVAAGLLWSAVSTAQAADGPPLGIGSGFFVSPQGHVLTAAHVVAGCSQLTLPGYGEATVLRTDRRLDVALLATQREVARWLPLAETSAVGDAISIFRLESAGTEWQRARRTGGHVTALMRHDDDARYLRLNARLEAGQSGAPVLNDRGQVIGIVVARLAPTAAYELTGDLDEGVVYAVKSDAAREALGFSDDGLPVVTPPRRGAGQVVIECR